MRPNINGWNLVLTILVIYFKNKLLDRHFYFSDLPRLKLPNNKLTLLFQHKGIIKLFIQCICAEAKYFLMILKFHSDREVLFFNFKGILTE